MKVDLIIYLPGCCHWQYLHTAETSCIQDDPFHYNNFAGLEGNDWRDGNASLFDAAQCSHTVEFLCRYGGVCSWIPWATQCNDTEKGPWAEKSWAEWWGVVSVEIVEIPTQSLPFFWYLLIVSLLVRWASLCKHGLFFIHSRIPFTSVFQMRHWGKTSSHHSHLLSTNLLISLPLS